MDQFEITHGRLKTVRAFFREYPWEAKRSAIFTQER